MHSYWWFIYIAFGKREASKGECLYVLAEDMHRNLLSGGRFMSKGNVALKVQLACACKEQGKWKERSIRTRTRTRTYIVALAKSYKKGERICGGHTGEFDQPLFPEAKSSGAARRTSTPRK